MPSQCQKNLAWAKVFLAEAQHLIERGLIQYEKYRDECWDDEEERQELMSERWRLEDRLFAMLYGLGDSQRPRVEPEESSEQLDVDWVDERFIVPLGKGVFRGPPRFELPDRLALLEQWAADQPEAVELLETTPWEELLSDGVEAASEVYTAGSPQRAAAGASSGPSQSSSSLESGRAPIGASEGSGVRKNTDVGPDRGNSSRRGRGSEDPQGQARSTPSGGVSSRDRAETNAGGGSETASSRRSSVRSPRGTGREAADLVEDTPARDQPKRDSGRSVTMDPGRSVAKDSDRNSGSTSGRVGLGDLQSAFDRADSARMFSSDEERDIVLKFMERMAGPAQATEEVVDDATFRSGPDLFG
jgi:hypothetical protein